jgi:hypothetical protein
MNRAADSPKYDSETVERAVLEEVIDLFPQRLTTPELAMRIVPLAAGAVGRGGGDRDRPFEEMLEFDYAYVAGWSMWHDSQTAAPDRAGGCCGAAGRTQGQSIASGQAASRSPNGTTRSPA